MAGYTAAMNVDAEDVKVNGFDATYLLRYLLNKDTTGSDISLEEFLASLK